MIDTFEILKTAYLSALRNNYTLEDGTILQVFTNWANVGTDVSTYILLDGLTESGSLSKCGNDATATINVYVVGTYTGNIDTKELYTIKKWVLAQKLTYENAQILTQRITSRELTETNGTPKTVQVITTFNHFIKQF